MGNDRHTSRHKIELTLRKKKHIFYVVNNDFPLREDGIIGLSFLKNLKSSLTNDHLQLVSIKHKIYEDGLYIPPNSVKTISIPIKQKTEHVTIKEKLNIPDSIYLVKDQTIHVIDEILDHLGQAKFFSAFDLSSGFHQIPLDSESRKYTAFSTNEEHFHYNGMPFGLKNAPATFQCMMDMALRGLIGKICFVYLRRHIFIISIISIIWHPYNCTITFGNNSSRLTYLQSTGDLTICGNYTPMPIKCAMDAKKRFKLS